MDKNFKLHDVIGDGACFFRSISYLLYNDEHQYEQIKKFVLSHLTRNPDDIVFADCYDSKMSIENNYRKYEKILMNKSYWGGYFECFCISNRIGCQINLFSSVTQQFHEFIPKIKKTNRVLQIYHTGNHYMSIVGKNQNQNYKIIKYSSLAIVPLVVLGMKMM